MKSLLAERHAFRFAVCLSGPQWERHPGPDNETAKEWNRLIDKRKEVKKYPIDLWQANYSRGVESGMKYRQIVKKARCTVYLKRLRLFDVMKTWSRYVISKLVQFRTGHALVGGWFKERGIQRDEGYNYGCGELETIQHIIQQCSKRAEERKKLKKVSPNLELPNLLNTKKGLQATVEFIMTGRKHDTAKLEVRQIDQSSSRQLEATQAMSEQADSSESGSD